MINAFLSGAIFMACAVVALHFAHSWRRTRDRLFSYFAVAFAALACERVILLAMSVHSEINPCAYFVRMAAFLLIIGGIVDKNRR